MRKLLLCILIILTGCSSAEKVKPNPNIVYNGKAFDVSIIYANKSVYSMIGLYRWNSFEVVIQNTTNISIHFTPTNFALLNKNSGLQLSSLTLESVINFYDPVYGGLKPSEKSAIKDFYFQGGMLLPNAYKKGLVFFSSKDDTFNYYGDWIFYIYFNNETIGILMTNK